MADDIDRANDVAQASIDRIIANAPKFNEPSYAECVDCGEDIPYKRQQIGGIKRCIDCQNIQERRR